MIDISIAAFVGVALIVLATAFTQSVVGFGFSLLSVPITMQVIGLHRAVILASLIGTANNLYQYRDLRHDQDKVQVKRFLWASFIGAPLGLIAFIYADQHVLKIFLGVGILLGVILLIRGRDLSKAHISLDWTMGVVSGFLLTSTSTNGPPLVFALQARKSEPHVFRSTLNMIFLVSGLYGLLLFAIFGEIGTADLWLAVSVLPSMVAGVTVGKVVRNRVHPDRFRVAVLVLLAIAGANSVYSGLLR
ncbi:MAG: sulfite exporter TauE/SafE family protein [Actinomycetota bacterium]